MFSDFAVFIAILSMTVLDNYINIPTPKLDVPSEFRPTLSTRSWIIDPFVNDFKWWLIAFFPAMFGVILIFLVGFIFLIGLMLFSFSIFHFSGSTNYGRDCESQRK